MDGVARWFAAPNGRLPGRLFRWVRPTK
jgi:hypothetical protein